MSTVEVRGLLRDQAKQKRKETELAFRQANDLNPSWVTEDKSGRCYTYRGVEYCYR